MLKFQIRRALALVIVAAFLLVPSAALAQPSAGQLEVSAAAHGTFGWLNALWFQVQVQLRLPFKSLSPEGNNATPPPPLQTGGEFDPWG